MKTYFFPSILSLAAAFAVHAEVVKIELPTETATYKPGPGADIANAQCLSCHSVEYVSLQPALSRTYWKGSVDKMITKYGAPVPTEQIEPLIEYLSKNYGTEATNAAAGVTIAAPSSRVPTKSAKDLAIAQGCFNCHQTSNKLIGPSYKEVAAKYRNDPGALAKVSEQIANGGSGKWGIIPMPPYKQLSPDEVKLLGEWVLSQQ